MNQTEIDELRRLHEAAGPGEAAALIPAVLHALHALLDAAEERDALLRIINDSFLSLNNPTSTLAFDGRNLVPHVEEASRYAEILRLERDELLGGKILNELAITRLTAERDALKAKLYPKPCGGCPGCGTGDCVDAVDAAETQAWDALGRPEGTHDTSNVQRLCEAHGALKAKLAEARAERLGYRAEYLELLRRIREGQLVTATEASMRYEGIIAASSEEPL